MCTHLKFASFRKIPIHRKKIAHKQRIVDHIEQVAYESPARSKALIDDKFLFLLPHDAPFKLNSSSGLHTARIVATRL